MAPCNQIKFHRNPDSPGIEIYEASRSMHKFPNHSHDTAFAFSLMEDGGSYWNGKHAEEYLVKPSDIAVIPPAQVHSGSPVKEKNASYKTIYIDNLLISDAASDILEKDGIIPEFTQIILSDPCLIPLYYELFYAVSDYLGPLELESALSSFIERLISGYATAAYVALPVTGNNAAVDRVKNMLSENLYSKITLDDAAVEAGLSKYHLIRSFKKLTGVPPHVYRTQKRIETAKKMILRGIPFSEIALETGFNDQSHFSNQFKHYTGTTPNQYFTG